MSTVLNRALYIVSRFGFHMYKMCTQLWNQCCLAIIHNEPSELMLRKKIVLEIGQRVTVVVLFLFWYFALFLNMRTVWSTFTFIFNHIFAYTLTLTHNTRLELCSTFGLQHFCIIVICCYVESYNGLNRSNVWQFPYSSFDQLEHVFIDRSNFFPYYSRFFSLIQSDSMQFERSNVSHNSFCCCATVLCSLCTRGLYRWSQLF